MAKGVQGFRDARQDRRSRGFGDLIAGPQPPGLIDRLLVHAQPGAVEVTPVPRAPERLLIALERAQHRNAMPGPAEMRHDPSSDGEILLS